ncbi:hypothetical protein Tco_0592770 [Tanacetum coccineum]
MSTSKTYQQSLADAGSENRPPMLERGSYIPWASRFRRYLNRKRDNRKWLLKALDEGPYEFKNFVPEGSTIPRLQTVEDLEGDDLLLYDAEMELMNMILLSIPNEIYNSVDACTSAKDIWTRLMNDLERNNMNFPTVTINTKFLNSLQPEWLKYVTQVHLAKRLTVDSFDDLFYYLQQFENLVNTSRAKKLEKSHDPLALVAHTGSSSRQTSSYYVTHPTSVVNYDDEYQQDDVHNNSEDPLVSAMLLLAKSITQNFSNLTNNHLRASSNTKIQAIIQGDRVNIQSRNPGNTGRNNRRAYVQEEVAEGMNAQNETGNVQRTLRTPSSGNTSTDEAGVILTDEQNDFLFADASRMEEIEELSANICLMARIQPADHTSDDGPSYESAFISEEAEKQRIFAKQVQTQNTHLTSQIEMYKERVRILEGINKDNNYLNEFLEADERAKRYNKQAQSQLVRDRDIIRDLEKQRDKLDLDVKNYKLKNEELQKTHSILKRQISEKHDTYHDTILDLKAKLKKNVDLILKLGNSLQGMFMLGSKPFYVYDQQLKHGLGYSNPYTLKQAISKCPKLYVASNLGNLKIPLNVRDSEDILEDAFKNFVPQKEPSVQQIFFPSSSIPSVKIPVSKNMPSESPLIKELDKIKVGFEKLSLLIQHNCKRASIFYTSVAEIEINDFCQDQVKPILNELKVYLECFQNLFQRDIKEMKDVFESIEHKILNAELEKVKKKSFEIQEDLQARIKILEKDLFDLIKKTRSQTQKEIDELIVHVSEKTYAYGAIRAENQNLLIITSELKKRLEKAEKGKSVNTNFDKTNGFQSLLCVTPLNKQVFKKKSDVPKTEKTNVVSKPITLQTSPTKQTRENQNTNVIRPGMYRVVTTQESQTSKSKSALSSKGMNATSRVRRPMSRDSHEIA